MKPKSAITIIVSLLILPALSLGSKKREIILGFGGGYSLPIDATLKSYEYNFPNLLYFKEQGKMEHCLSANVQYFFNRKLGLQLEFSHQKASYFSHLEWYGRLQGDEIFEINHIEEPYWKTWKLSSLTLSLLFAWRHHQSQRMYPYASIGIGLYFLNANKELVLNRWRLGPKKNGSKAKLGGGLKYRLSSKLMLNLKIFAETTYRRRADYGELLYVGSEQFDFYYYLIENKIARVGQVIVKTFSYGGIDLSLEFRL